jgi:D-tyrosyl-tRNA(Tyr) deacylase
LKAVVQRVREARVHVDDEVAGEIGAGLCILLGVAESDGEEEAVRLAGKVARLRIFENEDGKFDRSLLDTGGEALVVSQFTLIADTRRATGRASRTRPLQSGPSRSTRLSPPPSRPRDCGWRAGSSAPACRSSSSTTGP